VGCIPALKTKASGGSQTRTEEGAYAPCALRQERRGVLDMERALHITARDAAYARLFDYVAKI